MGMKGRHGSRGRALLCIACCLVVVLILPGIALAQDGSIEGDPGPNTDVGDAPTSYNHFLLDMTAYPAGGPPGVKASFPVVAFPVGFPWELAPPSPDGYGLCHSAFSPSYLGPPPLPSKSGERDADLAPDADDEVTNIDPNTDTADRDGHDDGVTFPSTLPHCTPVNVSVEGWIQVVVALPEYYIEAWFDWNRDGDWNDGGACGCGSDEWAIQDFAVVPDAAGRFTASIPIMPCHPGSDTDPLWARVTLSNETFAGVPGWKAGGRPLESPCLEDGETEDYYLQAPVEFVPEPGSLLFVGSGLAGLGAYATLRLRRRTRE
jgi:hypothetical protein